MPASSPLISIIIPCYQQARYLGDAIESVLSQTHRNHEIIVVDDGSTDAADAVAARYPSVQYLRQENSGTGTARNTGLARAAGEFFVLLDADDRLLPDALERGLGALSTHPAHELTFGRCRTIAHDGALTGSQQPMRDDADYASTMRLCPVPHPAIVMFRRALLEAIGGFDTNLSNSSDYDFYLRAARRAPLHAHSAVISEYRWHDTNKSRNSESMLRCGLKILSRQRPFVRGDATLERALAEGLYFQRQVHCRQAIQRLKEYARNSRRAAQSHDDSRHDDSRHDDLRRAWKDCALVSRHAPRVAAQLAVRKIERRLSAKS